MEQPKYYEMEEVRRAVNRKMWVVIFLLAGVTCGALLLAAAAMLRPTPVVAFDAAGRPIVFTDTVSPALITTQVRVDWFVRYFLEKYITLDANRLDEDLATAVNLMVPELREYVLANQDEIDRRKKVRGTDIRSRLEGVQLRIGEFDPQKMSPIFVYVWGKHVFERMGRGDEDKAERFVFGKLLIMRMGVTPTVPHGMLVQRIEWKTFDTEELLTAELLKLQLASGGHKNAH